MFRRLISVIAFLLCFSPLRAAVWQSAEFGVGLTLPDGPGWAMLPEGTGPTFRSLVGVINQRTNSMLGTTVLLPPMEGKSFDDAAVIEFMKKDLTASGYQILGYSKTTAGTMQCLQFPVSNKDAKGVVRVFAANGRLFTMALLRGDGKNALEDTDLMRAGASFRVTGTPAFAAVPAPGTPSGMTPVPKPATGATPAGGTAAKSEAATAAAEGTGEMNYTRIAIAGGVLLFLILMVWGIIGSGRK